MREILIAAVLLASGGAAAAPPTWADWVGDYQGALTWKQCTAPGERRARLPIDAADGAVAIDLAPAGAALRRLSLVREDGAWVAQDGDLHVRVTRPRANTIDLAIAYDSGCTARGRFTRASTGVPACDALVAWTRIEARCTKTSARREDAAAIAGTRWKRRDAGRCAARAEALALAMVDAGCAPHPDPDLGVRAIACRSLADATARVARCGRVPREIVQRLTGVAQALTAAAQTAAPATLPYVEQQCRDARADVTGTAVQFGCGL